MSKNNGTRKNSRGCSRWLLIVLLIPITYYGIYFIFRGPLSPAPHTIAHRGGPIYHPENTLPAFRYSIEQGIDWIEFDVQRTQDGVLIVFHDETVDRTTDGIGRVGNLTYDEIRALDAGNGEIIPTFGEVIELAKESGTSILPEAKSPHLYPGLADQMVAELSNHQYLEKTVIQSFDHIVLQDIQQAQVGLCPLYGLWNLNLKNPIPPDADVLCPMAEMVILNPWMIRQAHAKGKQVFAWFGIIEHPITMQLLLSLGVDGLMVDDPLALTSIVHP